MEFDWHEFSVALAAFFSAVTTIISILVNRNVKKVVKNGKTKEQNGPL